MNIDFSLPASLLQEPRRERHKGTSQENVPPSGNRQRLGPLLWAGGEEEKKFQRHQAVFSYDWYHAHCYLIVYIIPWCLYLCSCISKCKQKCFSKWSQWSDWRSFEECSTLVKAKSTNAFSKFFERKKWRLCIIEGCKSHSWKCHLRPSTIKPPICLHEDRLTLITSMIHGAYKDISKDHEKGDWYVTPTHTFIWWVATNYMHLSFSGKYTWRKDWRDVWYCIWLA